MAAVVAMLWNRDIAAFYGRLRDAGKPFKVAITAVMRKLLLLANTLLKEGRTCSPTPLWIGLLPTQERVAEGCRSSEASSVISLRLVPLPHSVGALSTFVAIR